MHPRGSNATLVLEQNRYLKMSVDRDLKTQVTPSIWELQNSLQGLPAPEEAVA